jgi:hypothetical protein
MEKVMYLVWLEQDRTREEVAERLLGPVREELMALAPRGLSMDVWDPASDIPAPVPTPEGETPLHGVVSVWLDTVEQRAPFEEVLGRAVTRLAGYSVVESLYTEYGANEW